MSQLKSSMSRAGEVRAGAVPKGVSSAEGEVTLEIWRLLVSAGVPGGPKHGL